MLLTNFGTYVTRNDQSWASDIRISKTTPSPMTIQKAESKILEVEGREKAVMVLEDGTVIHGIGFGAYGRKTGEIVFSTAMNGYTEALTDPSYKGQILTLTNPLIGNYGVPPDFESRHIQVEALVVARATQPSHPRSKMSLHEWLASEGVPGIMGVDTRLIVKKIRDHGVMGCALEVGGEVTGDLVQELMEMAVDVKYDGRVFHCSAYLEPTVFGSGKLTIALIDFGVKDGVIRSLVSREFRVCVYPSHYSLSRIMDASPHGFVLSNGPGNPAKMDDQIRLCAEIVEYGLPILGICLGHQLIAHALGLGTFKMPYGHRGINKPCRDLTTGKCIITLQNHGYTVDPKGLQNSGLRPWFVDCDDGTIEGLLHEKKPILTTQFHPEGSPGPQDGGYVLDLFKKLVEEYAGYQ
jgi:carbamoyl-phosphate synthase small subunit